MKKLLMAALVLAGMAGVIVSENNPSRAQGQPGSGSGPGEGEAVLKFPGSESLPAKPSQPPANPGPGQSPAVMGLWNNPALGLQGGPAAPPLGQRGLPGLTPPSEGPDPNQDILVAPAQGPWMISVICYTCPEAPQMARQMVMELRNSYKLPAFVFNHGAEERKKEYQRVQAILQQQKQFLKERNLTPSQPLRVSYMRIPEQCAVLVGGYPDDTSARRDLDRLKKLTPPDPSKVKLNLISTLEMDLKTKKIEQVNTPINPFSQAFVARNPTCKTERPGDWDKQDLATLKRLNADEPYNLLNCKKPLTLAIKQFQTPNVVQPKSATGSFLENLALGKKTERLDHAAHDAHELAKGLRKFNLETYVLHTKYLSYVTVGNFDGPDDPNLKAMQNLMMTRFNQQFQFAQLFPTPLPMQVPR